MKKKKMMLFPYKATYPLKLFIDFAPEIIKKKKKHCGQFM